MQKERILKEIMQMVSVTEEISQIFFPEFLVKIIYKFDAALPFVLKPEWNIKLLGKSTF